jgi:hypothetical protein
VKTVTTEKASDNLSELRDGDQIHVDVREKRLYVFREKKDEFSNLKEHDYDRAYRKVFGGEEVTAEQAIYFLQQKLLLKTCLYENYGEGFILLIEIERQQAN